MVAEVVARPPAGGAARAAAVAERLAAIHDDAAAAVQQLAVRPSRPRAGVERQKAEPSKSTA
jgi:hypothetical protein